MKRKFEHPAPSERELTGPKYWRSLDELAATPGFKAQLEREFPQGAAEMNGVENEAKLQGYFVQRIEKFLTSRGRRLIGWDEILEGGMGPEATVMSWRGIDGAVTAARSGHDAVLSPWPTLYFDNRQSPNQDYPPGRARVISTQDVYAFDPLPPQLNAEEQKHILGVQGNLWTEHIRTEERVEYMAWPRLSALAEVLWSPRETRDPGDFTRRLDAHLERMRILDVNYFGRWRQAKPD